MGRRRATSIRRRVDSGDETGPIDDVSIIPTGYERGLPPELSLLVRARRRALCRKANGRVLDLGGAAMHAALWPSIDGVDNITILDGGNDSSLLRLAREGARYDTVVSVFQLASAPDLDATIRRLANVLAPGGQLLFLEPARMVGVFGQLQQRVAPAVALFTPWRVDRDIPAQLRANALSVTDLDRHRVPTLQWWLRSLQEGRAHHVLPPQRREAREGPPE